MDREKFSQIEKDFSSFKNEVFAIILFGSFVKAEQTKKVI